MDPDYLKTYCQADFAQANNLMMAVAQNKSMELNIDNTCEYLTGIFPNADPDYLRSSVEKFQSENDVKNFVEDKLTSNNYPTREQYCAMIKVTEEKQRYMKNFNVEQFLKLFPDPFTHFEDETRNCEFSSIALEFLKDEFSCARDSINRIYRNSKYNMSIAAKKLRLTTDVAMQSRCGRKTHKNKSGHIRVNAINRSSKFNSSIPVKNMRFAANFTEKSHSPHAIPIGNIPLFQEMAFIRHREAIRKHMEAVRQKEEEDFNTLKAVGGLWTCECCYDDECLPTKCSTCGNAHVFCNSCVANGTNSKLGDGEPHVPCFLDCGSEFSISTLQKALPPTKLSILLKKRQAAEVMAAGLEGLVSCPFCDFASIPPEGEKVFKCLNPECMKESCILCKEPNHLPFKCGELEKNKARKYIEEKMTQALTRTCYRCKKVFFKEEGCNKMTCVCGAMMCYICNKPITGYEHFYDQGSNDDGKCPLSTDNQLLNAETVRRAEEYARREILQQDPTLLDIGNAGVTPALPPTLPMAEPNPGVLETHNIANRIAARVLNAGRFDLHEHINQNHT